MNQLEVESVWVSNKSKNKVVITSVAIDNSVYYRRLNETEINGPVSYENWIESSTLCEEHTVRPFKLIRWDGLPDEVKYAVVVMKDNTIKKISYCLDARLNNDCAPGFHVYIYERPRKLKANTMYAFTSHGEKHVGRYNPGTKRFYCNGIQFDGVVNVGKEIPEDMWDE